MLTLSVVLITRSQCLFLNLWWCAVTVWCLHQEYYDQCIDNIKSVTSAGGLSAQSILFMLIYGNDRSSTLTLHFLRPSYDTSFPQSRVPRPHHRNAPTMPGISFANQEPVSPWSRILPTSLSSPRSIRSLPSWISPAPGDPCRLAGPGTHLKEVKHSFLWL